MKMVVVLISNCWFNIWQLYYILLNGSAHLWPLFRIFSQCFYHKMSRKRRTLNSQTFFIDLEYNFEKFLNGESESSSNKYHFHYFFSNLRLLLFALLPLKHFDSVFGLMNTLNSNVKSLPLILHTCYRLRIVCSTTALASASVSECGFMN